jgi:hypothetical protein
MKHSIFFILLAYTSLTACQQNTDSPKQVAEKYWQALKNGDTEIAKQLVSKNSQTNFDSYLALPDDKRIALDRIKLDDEKTTVHTTITSQTSNANQDQTSEHVDFETTLVMEGGQWKIDAARSHAPSPQQQAEPFNDDQLSEALQKNLDSMDEALEEGADMLNEFVQEGSREMNESLLKGMNKLNESLHEAIEKMKQRREQQESSPPPANENGEGLL